MEIINKPDLKIFASEAKSGEIAKFPDILRGWGITFEQTQGKPPLEWMNDAFNRVDLNNLYLLQQGIPEWQKDIRYPKNAVVKKDNKVYICLEENENSEPTKYSEKWGDLFGNKRDLDDNVFHGFLQVHADEDIGTGVFLICPDGKVRGQMVYNNYGLQFSQVQEDGTSQTFTFPRYGQGGEILTDKVITNELGDSKDLVASQSLVNQINAALKQAVPVGFVANYVGETAPNEDWLIMRGQKYDTAKYSELYDLLKTDTLPDGRGVMLRGLDAGRGFDPNRKLLSYQEDAMQKITGEIAPCRTPDINSAWLAVTYGEGALIPRTIGEKAVSFNGNVYTLEDGPRGIRLDSSRSTRTNTQDETVSKNIALNIIIKVK